jgi:LCP family protein required for cell wall assembly
MKPQRHSIDGFVPRRPGSQLGEHHNPKPSARRPTANARPVRTEEATPPVLRRTTTGLNRSDIDESLKSIEAPVLKPTKKARSLKHPDRVRKARRITKWAIIGLLIVGLIVGGWLAYKVLFNGGKIFKSGGVLGLLQSKELKMDENGRSNILLLGTSEDDPGHEAGYLTDSMMVMSIDQKSKGVVMFSIPRDLYVKYGQDCVSGNRGKINAYFSCVNDGTSDADEQDRLTKTQQFIGEIMGLDIQYGVHVNNTVIKEAVDAVGGVDVDIQGNGPVPYGVAAGSVLDRNFDWRCNYKCYLVKYSPGVHHLDGEHALFLAMARGDSVPTYGLAASNPDREKNQQKIILALKQKAISTGTMTDLGKITGLIDSLGNNLRTNFDTSEIRTLMQLGKDIKPENIANISLSDGDTAVVTTDNIGGASSVVPVAGLYDYSGIQAFLKEELSTNPITREKANIMVLNGSETAGVAQTEADKLTDAGFIVADIDNAPAGKYADIEVYQIGTGMTATKAKLESLYGVQVKTTKPPVTVNGNTNFVVIFGKDRSSN